MKKLTLVILLFMIISCQKQSQQTSSVSVQQLEKSGISWEGSPLPKVFLDNPEVSILKITIPPHTILPIHKHPVINAGYMVSGELVVVKEEGGQELHLKAGDTLVEMVESWHYGENRTSSPAEIVVFYIGNKGQPLTIKRS